MTVPAFSNVLKSRSDRFSLWGAKNTACIRTNPRQVRRKEPMANFYCLDSIAFPSAAKGLPASTGRRPIVFKKR
jgi:hypothetical protein